MQGQRNQFLAKQHEFLDAQPEQTDIEKAWHGLHWLLTGTDWYDQEALCE